MWAPGETGVYLPKAFEQTDRVALATLMRERPLATLIVSPPGSATTADLIPLEYDALEGEWGMLRGHVARANALWRHAGAPALALFTGPAAYVSPGWYPSKREHGNVVPTWNYTMVQARGTLAVVDDAPWLRSLVGRLTDQQESAQPRPWAVNDAPEDYVQQMLRAIVGIEIELTSLVGKWKVSQNKAANERAGVAAGLQDRDAVMAALVREAP
jgi:transcriptional regulator